MCRASGGKTRWATRPGESVESVDAGQRIDFRRHPERHRLIQGKPLAPLLHQIPRRPDLLGNPLIGPLRVRQQHDVHAADRLLGRFPGPAQRFQGLVFRCTYSSLQMRAT